MRVDVYTLVVEVGEAGDAAGEGVRGRAVAGVDVVVVALPEGEVLPGDGERGGVCFGCGAFFVGVLGGGGRHCFFLLRCVLPVLGIVLGFSALYVDDDLVGNINQMRKTLRY